MKFEHRYDSMGAFLEVVKTRPCIRCRHTGHERDYSNAWAGGSLAEAIRLAEDGWPEGLSNIEEINAELRQDIAHIERRFLTEYGVAGHAVDVGRFVAGDPECMMSDRIDPADGTRIVRMGVNVCYSGSLSHDIVIRRGAGVCALIDALESAGVRIELTVAFKTSTWRSDCNHTIEITLKQSGDPLDRESVAYALMHPTMLRRLVFAHMEVVAKDYGDDAIDGEGRGIPSDPSNTDQYDIWFGSMCSSDPKWRTVAGAVQTVNETVAKYAAVE